MLRTLLTVLLLASAGCAAGCANAQSPCRAETVAGTDYTICSFDTTDDIRLFHSDAGGRVLGDFKSVESSLHDGHHLLFAMNAGMYHRDRSPVGLYVEDGVEQAPLVARAGPGNFGMLPNGVFSVRTDGTFHVDATPDYSGTDVRHATQSGPMLVIGGALHPRFLPDSTSLKIRNGVGVRSDGSALFAKSETPLSFHSFARLFRDELGTPDALYLDGTISRLHIAGERSDGGLRMGPIVGVVTTD